jgi:multiple sugar transport system ATP-binding protein
MNFIPGRVEDSGSARAVVLANGARLVMPPDRFEAHEAMPVTVGLRPEHLHWAYEGPPALTGTARVVEPLGADTLVVFDLAGCEVQARLPPRMVRHAGDAVRVTIAPENIHLFDPASGRRL